MINFSFKFKKGSLPGLGSGREKKTLKTKVVKGFSRQFFNHNIVYLLINKRYRYTRIILKELNQNPNEYKLLYEIADRNDLSRSEAVNFARYMKYRGHIDYYMVNVNTGPELKIKQQGIEYITQNRLLLVFKEYKDVFTITLAVVSIIISGLGVLVQVLLKISG